MKNIVLTGMPGSGKTTVAEELKKLLPDFLLVDIDDEIVSAEKRSINLIFERDGEEYFRDVETKMIRKHQNSEKLIISTGGGVVEREENIEILKQMGKVFYLYCDVETLLKRVKNDTNRPLLKVENVKEKLENLFLRRHKKYSLADCTIDVSDLTPAQIAKKIVKENSSE